MFITTEYSMPVSAEVLADTGSQVTGVVILGVVLLVLAVGLILLARRKKQDGDGETTETADYESSLEQDPDAGTPRE